jgi:CheY-like chemotaxis protein
MGRATLISSALSGPEPLGASVAGYPRTGHELSADERWANARRTILVVDDDRALRDTLTDILQLQGYIVLQAANGDEALDVLRSHVDVVILDLHMPGRDGLEVLERVGPTPPQVILYSAFSLYSPDVLHRSGVGTRVFRVLHKPIPPGELLDAVAAAIAQDDGGSGGTVP